MKASKLIGVALAVCALAAVTSGIAQGSSSKGTSSTARSAQASGAQPTPGGGGPPAGGPGSSAVHSESVGLDKAKTAFVTQTTDQGTVQSVDASAGTITLTEGIQSVTYKTLTLTVPADASVMRNGNTSTLSAVLVGDRVSVSSSSDGTTVFATDSSFHPEGGAGKGGPGGPKPPQQSTSTSN